MPWLREISIENFRSIGETPVTVNFPFNEPLILIGENNSGKTNIIRAIDLLFGEFHPKYKKLDDFDHYDRNPNNKIVIQAEVDGILGRLNRGQFRCRGFKFACQRNRETEFYGIQAEDGLENPFVATQVREELLSVIVNSEQNLGYQLSYSTKYTLLSKVTKAFHDRLAEDEARVQELKTLFNSVVEIFKAVPEFHQFIETMSSVAGEMLANMSHALQFDFSAYDPSNYYKTLRVHPSEEGHTRSFEELGTGQQQILAMSFAHAYARSFIGQGIIFIVDEPEAHLHPLAQRWLAQQMFTMAEDGLQIVITTHSPYFIDLKYLNSLYLVKKSEQTTVKNITARDLTAYCHRTGATRATENTIIPFYSTHSTTQILNGFFANKIILVEGPTEELSLPIYLAAVGLDCLKKGVAVIGVGGKGNIAKWWRLFTAFGIPTFICFDNDRHDDSREAKRQDALKAIGIADERIASLLEIADWNMDEYFCVFGRDFEETLRNSFRNYVEEERIAINTFGDSKPIVAREVARRMVVNELDDGWRQFRALATRIEDLRC